MLSILAIASARWLPRASAEGSLKLAGSVVVAAVPVVVEAGAGEGVAGGFEVVVVVAGAGAAGGADGVDEV